MEEHAGITPEEVHVDPVLAVQVHTESGTDPSEMSEAFGTAFGKISDFIQASGVEPAGQPRAIYTTYTPGEAEFTVAIPVASDAEGGAPDDSVLVDELSGGKALRFKHEGAYEELSATYDQITEWMQDEGMLESEADWEAHAPIWEEYMNDPQGTSPEELLTYIYVPIS